MNNKWRVALTSKVILKVVLLNISEAFETYDALPYMKQKYSTKRLCPILLVNYVEKKPSNIEKIIQNGQWDLGNCRLKLTDLQSKTFTFSQSIIYCEINTVNAAFPSLLFLRT